MSGEGGAGGEDRVGPGDSVSPQVKINVLFGHIISNLTMHNITVENVFFAFPLIMHGLLRWWQNIYSLLIPYQVPEALLQVVCDSLQPSAGGGVPRQLQEELLH